MIIAKNLSINQDTIDLGEGRKLTIESNRSLGGAAAVLMLVGIVSQISTLIGYGFPQSTGALIVSGVGGLFGFVSLIGFILFLVAMYGFSKDYQEHRIFNYLLYGILITIVATVVLTAILFVIVLNNFATLFPNFSSSASGSAQISSGMSRIFGLLLPLFSLVGVIWIAFNVKAFNLLSDKTKVPLFRTGAKVLLAGVSVNIVIASVFVVVAFGSNISLSLNTLLALLTVGAIVQDIAWVLLAMAYFRIQPTATQTPTVTAVNVPAFSEQMKYCPNCGAQNQTYAKYCTRCGQKL